MSEWKTIKTSELINQGILEINDGYRAKNSELSKEGLPFARAQNINNGFIFNDADCFPLEDLKRVGKKISKSGDVVFTSKGTVGRFAFVRNDTPQFVYAPQLCFWRSLDESAICSRWLYYWMQSIEFYRQYKGVSGQTDMAEYVSLQDQRKMKITLPPLQVQKRIASILGAFDDKIELNRQMNTTLEGMAQALFKSWFVDFDPVRVKAEGRPTGLPSHIAKLFPSEFEDSTLGQIPKGWKVGALCDLFDIHGGGTPKTSVSDYWNGSIPWFSVTDSPSNNVFVIDTEKHITEEGLNNSSVNLLPIGTTVISARGTVGKCCIAGIPMTTNQSCYALRAKKGFQDYYVYFSVVQQVENLQRSGHGSVFNTITRNTFTTIFQPLPPPTIVDTWETKVTTIMQRMQSNAFEINTLSTLRDTLLPKLLSGEIKI